MNDHKEHIIHYSMADLQRYVQGKMSAGEMHALEKAALDDPFLADAIEGLQQAFEEHDEDRVIGQWQALQQQVETRIASTGKTGKVIAFKPFRWWQAVAAAVIILITGFWIYSLVTSTEKNSAQVVAKTDSQQPKEQTQAPALSDGREIIPDTFVTPTHPANATTPEKNIFKYKSTPVPPAKASAPSESFSSALSQKQADTTALNRGFQRNYYFDKDLAAKRQQRNDAAFEKSVAPAATAPESVLKAKKEAMPVEPERETELITIAKSDSQERKKYSAFNNNLSGVIKGQVTDQNNNPIANAYLQIPHNNNNFVTDKTGFFKIPATSDSVVDVTVNVTGYGSQNFRLQNNALAMNQLQLQPANAGLDEVVVKAIKGKKSGISSNNKLPNTVVHDAEPTGGWVAFDQYLATNKKTPAGVTNTGNVLVSFEVSKKGVLSGFKIEQSLSKECDDEAIRLIMQGPSWKLLKRGRKARVTVMVRF